MRHSAREETAWLADRGELLRDLLVRSETRKTRLTVAVVGDTPK
jgi:hypothetical protein